MTDFYNEDQPLRGETLDEKLDVEVRHGFIRKVFGILTVQLLFTTLIATPFVVYYAAARTFIMHNQALFVLASILPLAIICCAICNPSMMRTYPQNYVFLSLITLSMGLTVGVICVQYTAQSIVLAAGMTTAICGSLIVFAMQTKHDFTGFGPYLFTLLCVFVFTGLLLVFFPYSRPVEIVYSSLGVLLFSFYLVHDVQMIVGGKHHQQKFMLDDYCFAALTIYLDIINIFLYLLRLFGDRR